VAAGVAGDDFFIVDEGTAIGRGVAGEGGDYCTGWYLPQLQRVVMGGGNDEPPVRTQRHAIDTIGVAGEGAEYAAGLHLPYLQRRVERGGNGEAPTTGTTEISCCLK
jgi:hypothetical protein